MRIAISGKAGSGKSTVARLLSKKLGLEHYSIGDLMRAMASEKNITLMKLNRLAEKDKSIDFELDDKLKYLGKLKNNFVVDGRLAAFFIPNAEMKVFLETDDDVRAERILKAKRPQEMGSLKEVLKTVKAREESEKIRYKKYYGIDYTSRKLYDFVIDTTKLTPDEVVEKIIKFMEKKQKSL